MPGRRLWSEIASLDEHELRLQVVVPLLRATPGVSNITDVHGQNERGLDVIFFVETAIESTCYGLQLKTGPISGGGTGDRTVKQIVDQLELAADYAHPIATRNAGEYQIDVLVVCTSGKISGTAREEIGRRLKKTRVRFWDGEELIRQIHKHLPQLFQLTDGASVAYLRAIETRLDVLDALDQIPGVAKRTLSQVFEEPRLRRKFDPSIGGDGEGAAAVPPKDIGALALLDQPHHAVLLGEQDAGKTSILRMLAIRRARAVFAGDRSASESGGAGTLPIILRARTVLGSGLTLGDAIAAELRRLNAAELADTLLDDLTMGHYAVLIDGFSELASQEDKDLVATFVERFVDEYPLVRLVVAARPSDFLTLRYFPKFHQYTIEDFNEQQAASLARRWVGESASYEDVAARMVDRLRTALQLPGSPIPATIGVMLHEREQRFITNTAEAIDRYMVIRLGRYAQELGMKQTVDWARKQDILAEVAFAMVEEGRDMLPRADMVARFDAVFERQGEEERGSVMLEELVASGVLALEGDLLSFHRTSFRDFFAAHHVVQRGDLDAFVIDHLFDRHWGGVAVFAAGLRRRNSDLLNRVAAAVERHRAAAIGEPGDDYYYAAYLCGRLLSNSDMADREPRLAALRTCLKATDESIPEFERAVVEQFGTIGKLVALLGAEQTFFVTVGVPWLHKQLRELLDDTTLTDDQRYLLATTYVYLGSPECHQVLERAVRDSTSTRVLVGLDLLLRQLGAGRKLAGAELVAHERLLTLVKKRLAPRREEVSRLFELRSKALQVERDRMRRLMGQEKRERQERAGKAGKG